MPQDIGSVNPQADLEANLFRLGIKAFSNTVLLFSEGKSPIPSVTKRTIFDSVLIDNDFIISSFTIFFSPCLTFHCFYLFFNLSFSEVFL